MSEFGAEHHAILFALMARDAIERFGDEGQKAILEGVRRYGEGRGRRMAARAQADGHPNNFMSYLLYGELKFDETSNDFRIVRKVPYVEMHALKCSWYEAWRKHGLLEYGRLYCREIDRSIMRGFNPDFRFDVDGTLSEGAPLCRFLYYDGRLGLLDTLVYKWRKRRLGDRATRPWEFHLADLYEAITSVLAERFGEDGKRSAKASARSFAEEYGRW